MKKRQPLDKKDQRPEQANSNPNDDLFSVPEMHKGNAAAQAKFTGTTNPRELRAIHFLMIRPMPREQLDKAVGCANSPDLIFRLRKKGLEIPCLKIEAIDRDGLPCRPGVFYLTESARKKVIRWNGSSRQMGSIDLTLASWLSFAVVCAVLLAGLI